MSEYILTVKYKDHFFEERIRKLKWLNERKGIVQQVQNGFKFYDQNIAFHHLANHSNKINYRKLFFNAGMVWHYINEKYNNDENGYWFPTYQVCCLINSDNSQLINLVEKSHSFPLNGEYIGNYFSRMILSIATNNLDKLSDLYDAYMNVFENRGSWYLEKDIYTDIFRAFIDKDEKKIIWNLETLQTSKFRNARIKENSKEKYFSIYTSTFIKLAIMQEFEVEIESEYIPKQLLPFSPLEEYTIPYKFLRDYYREEGIDWRYDPIHPELQDWENDPENPDRNKGGFFKRLLG